MKLADHGTTGVRPEAAPTAANDDHHAATGHAAAGTPAVVASLPRVDGPAPAVAAAVAAPADATSGWDAFEIWRSRVRDPRRDANRAYRD